MSTTTEFKQSLQLRVAELTKHHTELLTKEREVRDELQYVPGYTHRYDTLDNEACAYSTEAAHTWDLKIEVEKCLSLYDTMKRQDHPAYKLENAANFIKSCIDSCVYDDGVHPDTLEKQLDTCKKMVEGLHILFVPCPQLTGWVDSLNLQLHNQRIRFGFQ